MNITLLNLHPPPADLQRLVRDGLSRRPRQLPAWMLYDAEGSRLFAEICRQPEYTLTQREIALLEENAAAIATRLEDANGDVRFRAERWVVGALDRIHRIHQIRIPSKFCARSSEFSSHSVGIHQEDVRNS